MAWPVCIGVEMSFDLGTAIGTIILRYTGNGAERSQRDIDAIKKKSANASEAIQKTGRAAGIAGLAIAAGIGVAVKTAADFEFRLSAVQAVSGATAAEMGQLREKAMQLGRDTAFSATESASAMEELIKAGLSTKDVLNGAADATVALAAAGEVDLPQAATIASNAMNQFGLAAKDLPRVADLIAGAANASAIDVSDFGMSLSQVGAVAKLAGMSFQDTAVAIAEMGNAGIKGSDAGTSLKSMLSRLQPSTKEATKAMKDLGIITKNGTNRFYDQNGKLKSLRDVQAILNGSTKKLTAAQKQMYLQTIFGSDAIRAAAILAGNGAAGFDKLNASMNKTTAAEVASARLNNLTGDIEKLKGSIDVALIQSGSGFQQATRGIVQGVTNLVNAFASLPPETQKTITQVAFFSAAGLLAIAAFIKVGMAILNLVRIIQGFRTALIALRATLAALRLQLAATWLAALGPIALVVAAIAAIGLVFVLLYKKSETFRNFVNGMWAGIQAAAAAVAAWFSGPFADFFVAGWERVKSAFSSVAAFLSAVWGSVTSGASAAWAFVSSVVTSTINAVSSVIRTIAPVASAVWKVIQTVASVSWNLIKAVIYAVIAAVAVILLGIVLTAKTAWNAISVAAKVAWTAVSAAVNAAINVVKSALNAAKTVASAVWTAIKVSAAAAWNAIKPIVTAVMAVLKAALNAFKAVAVPVWNVIRAAAATAWNAIKGVVSSSLSAAKALVKGFLSDVKSFFSNSALVQAGRDLISGLISGVGSMAGALASKMKSMASEAVNSLKSALQIASPSKVTKKVGVFVAQGFIDGIQSGIKTFAPQMVRTLEQFSARVASIKTTAAVKKAVSSIVAGANSQISLLNVSLGGINDKIKAAQDRFGQMLDERSAYADKLRDSVNLGGIATLAMEKDVETIDAEGSKITEKVAATTADFIAELKTRLAAIQKFRSDLKVLQQKGASEAILTAIKEAGLQAGGGIAGTLSGAGAETIAEINKLNQMINNEASGFGEEYASKQYDTGIKSQLALLAGLESQRNAVQVKMEQVAADMVDSVSAKLGLKGKTPVFKTEVGVPIVQGIIAGLKAEAPSLLGYASQLASQIATQMKTALKIKSPSRVGRDDIGENFGLGIMEGLESQYSSVVSAAMRLRDGIVGVFRDMDVESNVGILASAREGDSPARIGQSAVLGSVVPRQRLSGASSQTAQTVVQVDVNAPQNMSPEQVGDAVGRKTSWAISSGATSIPKAVSA